MSSIVIDLCSVLEAMKDLEARVVALRGLMNGGVAGATAASAGAAVPAAEAPAKRGRGRPRKERDPNLPKREANVWIKFTQKVDATLKEAGVSFKRVAESKKFAKSLKDSAGYEWETEAILKARSEWVGTPAEDEAKPDAEAEAAAAPAPAPEPKPATVSAQAIIAAAAVEAAAKKPGRKPKVA